MQPDTVTGDIVFVLQQKEHPKFKRKGDDLFVEHTLSLTEALCGFQFVITHLDGRQLLIKSQPGEVVKPGKYYWMDISMSLSAFAAHNWVCWIISIFYKLFNFSIGNVLSDLGVIRFWFFLSIYLSFSSYAGIFFLLMYKFLFVIPVWLFLIPVWLYLLLGLLKCCFLFNVL